MTTGRKQPATTGADIKLPPAFVNNRWCDDPIDRNDQFSMVDPRTEKTSGFLEFASLEVAERAVTAARSAFPQFSATSGEERLGYLRRLREIYEHRLSEMGEAISLEMGAPLDFAIRDQATAGLLHIDETIKALKHFRFEYSLGSNRIIREPVGVTVLITPWNWPANQIACKVAPAIAAGCTMVLKPSEYAPHSAILFADMLKEAGLPQGAFNMVFGDGPSIGGFLARHPAIDMVSFTGSHRAGVAVAQAAAPSIKRVVQELGGKSANIILGDLNEPGFASAVASGVSGCFLNAGQSCDAPSRMLVPRQRLGEAERIAKNHVAENLRCGPEPDADIGPLVNKAQFERVQTLITDAIEEGAICLTGGPGLPVGIQEGFFTRPTIFSNISRQLSIAQEEIFGPVLAIMPYDTVEEAIAIANSTPYGLSGYVTGDSKQAVLDVARRLRTGMVLINGASLSFDAPFGGYRQSGNGREWGTFGVEEFLETKAITGV